MGLIIRLCGFIVMVGSILGLAFWLYVIFVFLDSFSGG